MIGYWGVGLGGAVLFAFGLGLGGTGIWLGITLAFVFAVILLTNAVFARAGASARGRSARRCSLADRHPAHALMPGPICTPAGRRRKPLTPAREDTIVRGLALGVAR